MQRIFRLVAVAALFLVLMDEPPKKQAQAEVAPVAVNNQKVVVATSVTPTATPQPTPEPVVEKTPQEKAKATLINLGYGDSWYAVEYIGAKESSWNPFVVNSIGACGLFQALPCSKMNCDLSDVPCQVRWGTNYATQRYGNWHNAYSFWQKNKWW